MASFRGTQGTGVGLVSDFDNNALSVTKNQLGASDFLQTQNWEWIESQLLNSHVIMGHTRYPTLGTVSSRNAQPFEHKNTAGDRRVMLTHNGHINAHWDLTNKIVPAFQAAVDSEHVTKAMAEAVDPKVLLPTIKGGYAFVWYDEQKRAVFTAKNDKRSLYMCSSKDKKKIYYCSEDGMLKFLLDRCGIDYKTIVEIPEMECFRWDLDADKLEPATYFKYKEKVTAVVAQASTYPYSGGNGYTPHGKKGSVVWVKMDQDTAFIPYADLKNGTKSEWGKFYGTIPSIAKSFVEVNSVKKTEWEGDLQIFKKGGHTIPCRVQMVEQEDDSNGEGKYMSYRCTIEQPDFDKDIARLKLYTSPIHQPGFLQQKWVPGPGTAKITEAQWVKTTAEGCFHCTNTIPTTDVGKIGWQLIKTNLQGEDLYQGVCATCVSDISLGKLDKAI